jgi:hypothetical protein
MNGCLVGVDLLHAHTDDTSPLISNQHHATFPSGDTSRVEVGEVLLIDDVVTGFDDNKRARPCMVFRVNPPPRGGAWVVPRSTTGSQGTFVPAGTLPGLNKPGRFMYLPHRVTQGDLVGCESLGVLPDSYRRMVFDNVNAAEI